MDSGVPPPTATATRSSAVQCQPRVQTLVLGGLQETQCLVGTLGRHGKPVGLPSGGLRPTHLSSLIQLAAYALIHSFVRSFLSLSCLGSMGSRQVYQGGSCCHCLWKGGLKGPQWSPPGGALKWDEPSEVSLSLVKGPGYCTHRAEHSSGLGCPGQGA